MIEDSDETDEQIRVLDIIMLEDWKSGREIDGEFKEIHLMHYYEHYLENFSTLLFNGQTIHRIGFKSIILTKILTISIITGIEHHRPRVKCANEFKRVKYIGKP